MTDGAIAEVTGDSRTTSPSNASIGAEQILEQRGCSVSPLIGVSQVVADTKLDAQGARPRGKSRSTYRIEIVSTWNSVTPIPKRGLDVPLSPTRSAPRYPFGKDLFKGSPNRGGLDYRVCLESWELHSGEEKWENSVALGGTTRSSASLT